MLELKTKNALFDIWDQKCLLCVFWSRILKNYCHMWNQHPQICVISKFLEKRKMTKFWTKNVFLKYFWGELFKTLCGIWSQHPQICLIGKFCEKKNAKIWEQKSLILTKMPYFGIFGLELKKKQLSYLKLGILGLESENNLVIFGIHTLEFA